MNKIKRLQTDHLHRRCGRAASITGLSALALTATMSFASSDQASSFEQALTGGKVNAAMRLRYEVAEQDNALDDADALTLRTALGYTTGGWNSLQAFVEFESVAALLDDYSGTPPPVQYSVVADPDDSEVNQWGIRYTGVPGLTATLGRSKLIFDNARWVGNVGWRQNEQTFEGVFLKYGGVKNATFQYAYLSNVNNIFFNNVDLDAHLINAQWTAAPWLTLTAYGYLLEYEVATATMPDADTLGLRATGSFPLAQDWSLSYVGEFARQDAEVGANEFEADYWMAELALSFKGVKLAVAQEVLGSDDGQYAVMTPLATLHAFNGWNDVFLVTPVAGVEDFFVTLSGGIEKVKLLAVYHDFQAEEGDVDYGTEWGIQATRPIVGALSGGVKFAQYDADQFGVDTDKLWAWLQYSF